MIGFIDGILYLLIPSTFIFSWVVLWYNLDSLNMLLKNNPWLQKKIGKEKLSHTYPLTIFKLRLFLDVKPDISLKKKILVIIVLRLFSYSIFIMIVLVYLATYNLIEH